MGTVHARSILRAGGVITRIVGSSPVSSHAAAERVGATTPTDTVEQLLAADDVDIVHICTPNATHAPLVRAAIAAGKHVICEKPLAVNVLEAQELITLAEAAGVTATVPFVYRFYPTVREARAKVIDGSAGTVRLLHGSYLQDWLAIGHGRRLAGRRRGGRCFPGVRRHRGALVRSGRIRLRSSHLPRSPPVWSLQCRTAVADRCRPRTPPS